MFKINLNDSMLYFGLYEHLLKLTQKGHTPKKKCVPFITSYRFSYFWLSEKSITFLRLACMRS